MLIFTTKLNKKKLLALVIGAFVMVGAVILLWPHKEEGAPVSSMGSLEGAGNYLQSLGYELEKEPVRQEGITLPKEFDSVYEEYNNLQKECGFDLSPYKGKNLTLYTYRLTNYPGEPEAMADVLLKGEKVVGGSVYSAALDGFMHGLRPVSDAQDSSSNP